MELGSYQESVPVEYADGGTMDWADETSMPLYNFPSKGEAFAEKLSSYSGQWTGAKSSSLSSKHIHNP